MSRTSRIILCSFVVGAIMASAQTPTGRMTGAVTDPSGAAIPDVVVEGLNVSTGGRFAGNVNASGLYQLNFLPPGRYDISATAKGFKRFIRRGIIVETGAVVTIDIALEVGEVSESITVAAETPLLQPDSSSVNQIIDSASVTNIPVSTRRVGALLRILPNVTFVSENLTFGWADFSIAGGRGRQQNWSLDGGTIHGLPMFTGVANANPPMDAIEELRVESNNYPAEYGRSTGGYIVMTTKSGSNRFRGALYEYLRNDAFDARSFFAPTVAPRKYNVFGGTLGGPVIRNKAFFFFSYEGTRRRDGVTRILNVPTPAEKRGDFSQTPGTLLDPLTGQPVPGKIIPQSRLDPVGAQLATFWPDPNVPGAVTGANNFRQNAVNRQIGDNYVGRGDYNLGSRARLNARYLYYRGQDAPGSVFSTIEADPSWSPTDVRSANLTPSLTYTITPTFLSESRVSMLWRSEAFRLTDNSGVAGRLGIPGVDPGGMPRIEVLNYTQLGSGNQYRFIGPFRSTQLTQNFSYFRGKHTLKFGGEFRRSAVTDNQLTSRYGRFVFNDVAAGRGFALAAMLYGWSQQAQVSLGNVSSRMQYYGLFLQDDWKITNRLTFNLGLRWEMDTPWYEGFGRRSGFDAAIINPATGTPGDVIWQDKNNLTKYAHTFDRNNISPRFGFAWRPLDSQTVIRGGYGLIYGGIYDGSMGRVFDAGFGEQRDFLSPDNGITPASLLRNGVPVIPPQERIPGFGAARPGERVYFSPDFALADQRNPYSHQANFGVQHELKGGLLLEVGWLANLSHKIAGRDANFNEIRPERRGTRQDQALRPFPQYNAVLVRNPNWGNSSYHALNLKAQKRYSAGLSFLATYAWSKFLDDVQATVEAVGSGPQSVYERHSDKAPSGNDIRHRFTGSFVYELPFGTGRRFAASNRVISAIVSNWSVSGMLELRTGFYIGVLEQSNRLNAFSPRQRSNVVGDWSLPGGRSRDEQIRQWFNTSAFAFPGDGMSGNAARAFIPGPGSISLDSSLQRDILITERVRVQIRGEAYNALNRPNFSAPNVSRGSTAFGQIGGSGSGRFLQLSARMEF